MGKNRHYLDHLTDKSNEKSISDAEKKLLNDFVAHEYQQAEWDTAQMGQKEMISFRIYNNIQKTREKKLFKTSYKYALAASLALVVSLSILLRPRRHPHQELVIRTASATDSVRLHDGSLVYLAAHSIFKYPEHFSDKNRSVSLLKGNAFFKVAKDPAHPFIINSPDISTRVLGTSFHISLDHGKSTVTVVTGHVSVSSARQKTLLEPNEYVVFTPAGGLKKQKTNDMSLYAWYKKDLELNQVTLDKVFTLLGFKYGVNFNPANSQLLDKRITLYIKNGLPLHNILEQINYITHLKFEHNGETIEVKE